MSPSMSGDEVRDYYRAKWRIPKCLKAKMKFYDLCDPYGYGVPKSTVIN